MGQRDNRHVVIGLATLIRGLLVGLIGAFLVAERPSGLCFTHIGHW